MHPIPAHETQLDHTLIEVFHGRLNAPVPVVRPASAQRAVAVPAPAVHARDEAPRVEAPARTSPQLVAVLLFAAAFGASFSLVVIAAMAVAVWQGWLPALAGALFGLGGLLLAGGAATMWVASRLGQSAPTRYASKNSVVARAR
jgi:hypothetical protein